MGRSVSQDLRRGDGETSSGDLNRHFLDPIARPLAAVLCHPDRELSAIESALIKIFGPIKAKTSPHLFDHSTYYCTEMGPKLIKYHLVFDVVIKPIDIVVLKHETSRLEGELVKLQAGSFRRVFNIDPGYFTHAQLVLATHKNYAHRISLGQGVFAELTYLIEGRNWRFLPWTYPDYKTDEVRDFFKKQRDLFLKETKGQRPAPGSRIPMWQLMKPKQPASEQE